MYKSRIWKWGLDKKLKGDEVLAILHLKRERDAMDKRSEFRIRGQLVDLDNINRYLKRNPGLMQRYRSGQMPSIQTKLEVECRTPSPSPTRALAPSLDMQNTEAILALFRDYVDGSFSGGAWNCIYDVKCVSSRPIKDRSNDLFERVIASFALVNRCMMRGDNFSIQSMLNPSFDSLKEIVETESPVFIVRTVCLLWYLERHHKHDLLRMVIKYLSGLVPIVLGPNHIMTHIWRRLGNSEFSDYYELSMRLYAVLVPEMERRIGPANFLTHILYEDYMDCIYAKQGPAECEIVMRAHRSNAEAAGKNHPWLRELALSHAALIAAVREREGRLDEAVQVLAKFMEEYPVSQENAASLNLEMGVYSYKMGNVRAAILCAKRAAQLALTSDADERVSITSLANLERFQREAGQKADADQVLQYRMQLLAAFAERSVSLSSTEASSVATEDDDDDEDEEEEDYEVEYEFEPAALEFDDLPEWLRRQDDESDMAWFGMTSYPLESKMTPFPNIALEWAEVATTKTSSDGYTASISAQTSRRNSFVPPMMAGLAPPPLGTGTISPQPYSPFIPPAVSPQPEHMSRRSSSYVQPPPPLPPLPPSHQHHATLSPRPEGRMSPYYQPGLSPQPEGRPAPYFGPGLSPQPERTNPYYAPGLSPQPEKRSPYYVPSPPMLHLDQSAAYDTTR
jgi:hypothetical protein